MKKKLIGIICLSILFSIGSTGPSYADDVIKLSLNLAIPPTHKRWIRAIKPWIAEIEKRSEGKVKILPYFAQALSKQAEIYNSVMAGVADIGEGPLDRMPGQFPILENISAYSTPGIVIKDGTFMFNEFLQNVPQAREELKDVKVLFLHLSAPAVIGTSKVPIKKLGDMKGLKMASWGLLGKKIKTLGAAPIGMPLPDIYMALQKGVLDASLTTFTLLVDRKFGRVIHHVTPVTLGYSAFGMIMNKKVWEKLPEDVKNVFEEINRDLALKLFNKFWWEGTILAKKEYEESMGGKSYFLSADDMAQINKFWQEVNKKHVARRMKIDPLDAAKIEAEFRKLELKYGTPLVEAYSN